MSKKIMPLLLLSGVVILGIFFRCWLLVLPVYKYVYYDEAIPGLMALDILDGKFPLVYWAHPYLGSLDAFSAAGLFYLFGPSTMMLRISVLFYFVVFAVFLFKLGQRLTGQRIPWYLVLFLAIPPLGLNQFSLSTIGGYMHVVAMGTIMMYLTVKLLEKTTVRQEATLFALLGFFAGLGFWTFIMIVPYIAGCYGTLFLKYRLRLFRLPFFLSLLFFGLGSLPSWVWNIRHSFLGLTAKSQTVSLDELSTHIANLYQLFCNILGRTDEYAMSSLFHTPLTWIISGLLVAILLYWLRFAAGDMLRAILTKEHTPSPLDMVVICFAVSSAAFILSDRGEYSLIRYGMIFYSTLPLLLAWFFHRLSRNRKWIHALFVPTLLLMTLPYNGVFIQTTYRMPNADDMESLIDFMKQERIYHGYAHYTVGHPITFESGNEIIIADFGGYRNIDYLRKVDRSKRVAIITDRTIAIPSPDSMAGQLTLATCGFKEKHIGRYTVFYDFIMPGTGSIDVSSKIKQVYVGVNHKYSGRMTDRNLSTYWTTNTAQKKGDEIIIEFSEPLYVSQLSLLPGGRTSDFPRSLSVEASLHGKQWRTVKEKTEIIEAFLPLGNKPRLFGNGQLDICLNAKKSRFLRLRLEGDSLFNWSVAEFFVSAPVDRLQDGDLLSIDMQDVETILQKYPDAFIYASPWIATRLEESSLAKDNIFSLYPEWLLYSEDYRKWDFTKRLIDFTKENVFVVFTKWTESAVGHLQQLGIDFTLERKEAFTVIHTTRKSNLQKEVKVIDTLSFDKGYQQNLPASVNDGDWKIYASQADQIRLDGFTLTLPDKTSPAPEVKVFYSGDNGQWREMKVSTFGSSYWSDYSLLEINMELKRRYHFFHSVTAANIMVAVRSSDRDTVDFGNNVPYNPVFFRL